MEDFNENKNYQANSQNSWEEFSEIDPNLERQKEIERLSEQSYNLSVEISGLEFKLSKLEEN